MDHGARKNRRRSVRPRCISLGPLLRDPRGVKPRDVEAAIPLVMIDREREWGGGLPVPVRASLVHARFTPERLHGAAAHMRIQRHAHRLSARNTDPDLRQQEHRAEQSREGVSHWFLDRQLPLYP